MNYITAFPLKWVMKQLTKKEEKEIQDMFRESLTFD